MVQLARVRCVHRVGHLVVAAIAVAALAVVARAESSGAASPRPERVAAREAWKMAEAYASTHSNCEVMIGSGGSMMPLYPDRTVIIVERLPMSRLCAGMTVVFIGDRGRPVAHTLISKTGRGWLARGMANAEMDRTLVRMNNYVGTVVKAFTPVVGFTSEVAAMDVRTASSGE